MKRAGKKLEPSAPGVRKRVINHPKTKLPSAMPSFVTIYQDMIDGTWGQKWQEYQKPGLPKHRIDHKKDGVWCTCGVGPFKDMLYWSKHAKTFTRANG